MHGFANINKVRPVDAAGYARDEAPTYYYCTPPIAVGANKLWCDIFNATGSGKIMDVFGIWLVPKLDATLTGALAVRLDLYRTSAVGTGGTAASVDSATVDIGGGNFTKADENNAALPAQITARVAPSGGATIIRWKFPMIYAPEESNTSMGYLAPSVNWIPMTQFGQEVVVRENSGLLIKQFSVASLGSGSILIGFKLR